ncbi:hypothetical protein DFR29_106177 [Tahibacter aquaticus]|uniref:Uncharacterized protein n=1 Tax=Tahibacter aquaticus TaxID=520092 RepID=A0A4V3DMD8_9GAMM|nr:hypothetical protein [Tahibacter aquaticus]TDR44030.1 hypothetical protein DFR29_106177 [Tahibacter aquaticus]
MPAAGRGPRLRCVAACRRAGYRVAVEATPATPLRWTVFRPGLRTVFAPGIGATREAAIDAANGGIRQHIETTRMAAATRIFASH